MLALHPEFIVDENATQKAVVIKFDEWQIILEKLEELEEIESYDKAKSEKSEVISFEEAVKEIKTV